MNDVDFPVKDVLDGIDAAAAAGLGPIKINMVVKRGVNDQEIVPMARHFRGTGHIVRFIEFMDVGSSNGWRMDDVVPSAEVVRRIAEEMPLRPIDPNYRGEVAERWAYADGSGEIGVISSVTQASAAPARAPGCRPRASSTSACSRRRLRPARAAARRRDASSARRRRTRNRDRRHLARPRPIVTPRSAREATARAPKIEMSYIGG